MGREVETKEIQTQEREGERERERKREGEREREKERETGSGWREVDRHRREKMRQREERDRKRKGREKKKEEKYEKHRDMWGGATLRGQGWSTVGSAPHRPAPLLPPLLSGPCFKPYVFYGPEHTPASLIPRGSL